MDWHCQWHHGRAWAKQRMPESVAATGNLEPGSTAETRRVAHGVEYASALDGACPSFLTIIVGSRGSIVIQPPIRKV